MTKLYIKFILVLIFLTITLILSCSEESINTCYHNISFNFKSIKQTNNHAFDKSTNGIVNLKYSASENEDLYKIGVNLLVFGVICGVIGTTLIGSGFLLTWILSLKIGWTFGRTLSSLILSYSLFGTSSYYASLAISAWVVGGVFSILFLLIIPGIVLMSIGSRTFSERINPLQDGIGVSFKL